MEQILTKPQIRNTRSRAFKRRGAGYFKPRHWRRNPLHANGLLWMRRAPYGFVSEKVETQHGKRMVLKPHPQEAKYMVPLFELRASGQFSDREIAKKLNDMGYRGRPQLRRAADDRSRIIGRTEPALLDEKKLWKMVRNPIYAGINVEKWTQGQPVKCMFDGIVSIDLFNRANKGKRVIIEMPNNKIAITDNVAPENATPKGTRHPDFAFKNFVMCPECNKPLLGSSSRGKTGQYYSYYHCDKRGHKFRVKKKNLSCVYLSLSVAWSFPNKILIHCLRPSEPLTTSVQPTTKRRST